MSIKFLKAGKFEHMPNDTIFLQSRNRQYSEPTTVFHHNNFSTYWIFPVEFFKANFKYNHSSGVYKTQLTYFDCNKFAEIWSH